MPDKKRPGQEERKNPEKEQRPPRDSAPSSPAAKPGQSGVHPGEYAVRGAKGGGVSMPRQVTIEPRDKPLPATQKPSRAWEQPTILKREPAPASPDADFGSRLVAALKALPDEMKNDPAYADPVAWVKRARENTAPSDDSDDE